MLSLRKKSSSGPSPETGTASPFGGGVPFPLVVLPGGGAAPQQPSGGEIFDARVRRAPSVDVTARQAMVRALAGSEFPGGLTAPTPGAAALFKQAAPGERATPKSAAADAPAPSPAAPAREEGRRKLRIATRSTAAPFPVPAETPSEGAMARPEPPAPFPPAPTLPMPSLPGWSDQGMGSPTLPIPEPTAMPALGSAATTTPWGGSTTGAGSPWPVLPVRDARVGAAVGARLPVPAAHETERKGRFGLIVAGLVLAVSALGVGAWWQWNKNAQEEAKKTLAVARPKPPSAPPAHVNVGPKEPSDAFRAWAREARIKGVLERENGHVRALVNERTVVDGDYVDALLQLRLVGLNKAERRLIFEERGEARLEVNY